jgi:methionine-gamma-lyase
MPSFESICARDFHIESQKGNIPSHTLPIYQSSTFVYESAKKAMDVFRNNESAYIYTRWSNPTVEAVEEKIALLEAFDLKQKNGEPLPAKALMFSSGMAAISALFCSVLKPGMKILTTGNIYGTTIELMNDRIRRWGIETVFADLKNLEKAREILKNDPDIQLIYIESPTNPTLDCYDIRALSNLAIDFGCKVAVDNTFATPYLQQPFALGADFVVHSTTKYLNGHGNALGGVFIGKDIRFMETEGWKMRKLFGGNSNAMEAWLLNNGIKTLVLRMEKHCANAKEIATWLESHPKVKKVNYCGLKSHPDYLLAKRQMRLPGGMISFEVKGGLQAGINLMNNIQFCTLTSTLGTPDTLITHPASMTHVSVPKAQRKVVGISDGLIRLAVGIESAEDIISDLQYAMERI